MAHNVATCFQIEKRGFIREGRREAEFASHAIADRGGDYALTVGQDVSIGYLQHDAASVSLYLEESITFRVLSPEAAVPLRYGG